jgi:hypothetical protein
MVGPDNPFPVIRIVALRIIEPRYAHTRRALAATLHTLRRTAVKRFRYLEGKQFFADAVFAGKKHCAWNTMRFKDSAEQGLYALVAC